MITDARPAQEGRSRSTHEPHPATGRALSARDQWHWWWTQARHSAQAFLAGHAPPEIAMFGPVLDPAEHGLLEGRSIAELALRW